MTGRSDSVGGSIDVSRAGRVATVTINAPARRNALSLAMWKRLADVVTNLADDGDVRAIVLCGAGEEAFSAGANIAEFAAVRSTPEDAAAYARAVVAAQHALTSCRTLTVAAIRGICIGGGAALALACTVRVCDERLRFAIPPAKIGLVYGYPAVERLVRLAGPSTALDLLYSARTVGAPEALRLGVVNHVAEAADIDAYVAGYAARVAGLAPISMEGAWVAVRAALAPDEPEWREELAALERRAADSDDYREGVAANREKREPEFRGQ